MEEIHRAESQGSWNTFKSQPCTSKWKTARDYTVQVASMDSGSRERKSSPDLVSLIASVGAPAFVLMQLFMGGWAFRLLFLTIFAITISFYWWMFSPVQVDIEDPTCDSADSSS